MSNLPKVSINVDGMMVAIGISLVTIGVIYVYRDKIAAAALDKAKAAAGQVGQALNPVNPNNLANTAVTAIAGQDTLSTVSDYLFGAIDLATSPVEALRYLATGKTSDEYNYALKVYGLKN